MLTKGNGTKSRTRALELIFFHDHDTNNAFRQANLFDRVQAFSLATRQLRYYDQTGDNRFLLLYRLIFRARYILRVVAVRTDQSTRSVAEYDKRNAIVLDLARS